MKKAKLAVLRSEGFSCNTVEKVRHSLMQKYGKVFGWISVLKPCYRAVSSCDRLSESPTLHMHDSMAAMCKLSFST